MQPMLRSSVDRAEVHYYKKWADGWSRVDPCNC